MDEDLAPYPGGLEECLAKKFGKNKWNALHGIWIRGDDDTVDRLPNANDPPPLCALPTPHFHSPADRKAMRARHNRVRSALVDHFDHGRNGNY